VVVRARRPLPPSVIAGRRDSEYSATQPYRIGIAMVLDEAEALVRVPAKIAIDFLRNSHLRDLRAAGHSVQNEAKRFGAPLQIGEDPATILFLIVVGTRISIRHAVPEGGVEQDRSFAGGRRHGLRLARTRGQPTIKCAQRRIAPPDGRGRQPQQCGCPTGRSSGT
jgi:hypothetical protein